MWYKSQVLYHLILTCHIIISHNKEHFVSALNRFIADRYSSNHSVSEYHVYEFFKVLLFDCHLHSNCYIDTIIYDISCYVFVL